jgi:hypothetical protein
MAAEDSRISAVNGPNVASTGALDPHAKSRITGISLRDSGVSRTYQRDGAAKASGAG